MSTVSLHCLLTLWGRVGWPLASKSPYNRTRPPAILLKSLPIGGGALAIGLVYGSPVTCSLLWTTPGYTFCVMCYILIH